MTDVDTPHTLDEVKQGYENHVERCGVLEYKPWIGRFVNNIDVLYNLESVQNVVLTSLDIHTSNNLFRHVCKYGDDEVGYLVLVFECCVSDWIQMLRSGNALQIQVKVRKEFRNGCMVVDDLDGVFEYFKSGGDILDTSSIVRLYITQDEGIEDDEHERTNSR